MQLCDVCRNNNGLPKGYDKDIDSRDFELNCCIYGDIDKRNYCNNFNLIESNDLEMI